MTENEVRFQMWRMTTKEKRANVAWITTSLRTWRWLGQRRGRLYAGREMTTSALLCRSMWYGVVCFGKLGEITGEHLRKGSRVLAEGRLRTQRWQDEQGQDRTTVELYADDVIFLDSRRSEVSTLEADAALEPKCRAGGTLQRVPAPAQWCQPPPGTPTRANSRQLAPSCSTHASLRRQPMLTRGYTR